MHQTTSGETHNISPKKEIKTLNIENFIEKNKNIFENIKNYDVFYDQLFFSSDSGLNFFHANKEESKLDSHINAILKKEYLECERLYPVLGNIFLNFFFNQKISSSNFQYKINKKIIDSLLKKEKDERVKTIIDYYIKNCDLSYTVIFEKNYLKNTVLEKNNDMTFKNSFDIDFYSEKINEYTDYKLCIIDGYIQNVSEIHHILHKSNQNKIPYVIFCYGISAEVKKTIFVNNASKKTQVYPVSFEYTEENLNILNDISVIHNCEIISSKKGQVTSIELSKKLKTGKKITINPKNRSFTIEPVVDNAIILQHANRLSKKLEDSKLSDTSKKTTLTRIKCLNSKNLKIYINELDYKDRNYVNRLHFYFSFLGKLNLLHKKVLIDNKNYYVPTIYLELAQKKSKSLKTIFNNISYVIQEV